MVSGLTIGMATLGARQVNPPAGQVPTQGQPGAPGQGGGGGGRGRGGAPVAPYGDYTGFTKLWDGATFTNWEGERDVWSIQDGMLHADTTKTPGQHHLHYKGPGAVMKDFDLKVEFKISATGANGGIQYRSRLLHPAHGGSIQDPLGKPLPAGITTMAEAVAAKITSEGRGGGGGRGRGNDPARGAGAGAPGAPAAGAPTAAAADPAVPTGPCAGGGGPGGGGGRGPGGGAPSGQPAGTAPAGRGGAEAAATDAPAIPTGNPWQISGYQFDLNSANNYTGQLYEGQGRGIVTAPGTMVKLLPGRQSACLGVVTDNPASFVKPHLGKDGEWNQVQIIARGNTLVHMINGRVITVTIDDNPEMRAFQGILSLQLEGSGQIWYRNVYVKPLDPPMLFPEIKR
jgi:hypothetical protein